MKRMISLTASAALLALAAPLAAKPATDHSGHAGHAGHAKPQAAAADRTDGWGSFGVQTQWIDRATKPGDDFNQFVSGKWLATATIPADRTRFGSFDALGVLSETRMHAILEELAQGVQPAASDAARVAAAYKAYMDTDSIEKAGIAPLQPLIARVRAAKTPEQLAILFAEPIISSPVNLGVGVDAKNSSAHAIYARQAQLGMPDRDMYLVENPRFKEFQAKYKDYLTFIYTELGYADPAKTAADVYALEYKMAQANWDRTIGRNRDLTYNKMSLDAFAALAPNVPLKAMVAALGGQPQTEIIVAQLPPTADQLTALKIKPADAAKLGGGVPALAAMIASEPAGVWHDWVIKNMVNSSASVLPKRFDDANFAFYGKLLSGQPEQRVRWKRAIGAVEGMIGELVGKIYAERHFPAANKTAMEQLVGNLRLAMAANLKDLKWMGPETRKQAQAKLDAFTPKIGYPAKYKAYPGLEMTADSAFANGLATARWSQADQVRRLGQPVDRSEWGILPQTVNAYYSPTLNEIVFPAAILQPPFFNLKADPAINYGGIGAVIGHEIGHGFDDQGAKSDGTGNLRDWWTAEDKANFVKLTDALAAQYSTFCPLDDGKTCVNGRLTIGENIGDVGGISLAYRAYKMSLKGKPAPVIGGFTGDQRFFMGFAQVWRDLIREPRLRQQILTDPHSPARYRVNGTLPNIDEWYKAFNVKPGDKLYRPPEQRIRIW